MENLIMMRSCLCGVASPAPLHVEVYLYIFPLSVSYDNQGGRMESIRPPFCASLT